MSNIEVTLIDYMGNDLTTVNAARVSFNKESDWEVSVYPDSGISYDLSETDQGLIKYLGEHDHISPFGHSFASFRVKAPIFVARQLVKHKFLRWNEVSRRYVDSEPEFYVPEVVRGRHPDKKQGSSGIAKSAYNLSREIEATSQMLATAYQWYLDEGMAPEQARMILPQNTMTEWYWSGSLDAFASMCNLRCKEDTQYESRLVADQIDKEMALLFPHSWEALRK